MLSLSLATENIIWRKAPENNEAALYKTDQRDPNTLTHNVVRPTYMQHPTHLSVLISYSSHLALLLPLPSICQIFPTPRPHTHTQCPHTHSQLLNLCPYPPSMCSLCSSSLRLQVASVENALNSPCLLFQTDDLKFDVRAPRWVSGFNPFS